MKRRGVVRGSVLTIVLTALTGLGAPLAHGQTCDAVPLVGCRQPVVGNKALLMLKNKGGNGDKLVWKWIKGAATAVEDFGDPLASTAYTLCIYDETGGTPSLALTAFVPAGGVCDGKPCWSVIGKGFKYKDPGAANAGINALLLKFGEAGKAKIVAKGKDDNLDTPSLPLAQDQRVIVQLKNQVGVCWEASYGAPATKHDDTQFKDKGDEPGPTAPPSATPTPAVGSATPTATRTATAANPTATNTAGGNPPTSTRTSTATATRTATATFTATTGSSSCGNGFLQPGETCANCPADCVISPCTPTSPTPSFAVQLASPLGSVPTTVTVLVGYQSDLVSLPGSGNATTVRQRITYPPPPPFPQEPNDLNYALRLVVGRSAGFPNGLFATVRFDRCQGAPAPLAADFGCTVEACAGTGGPIVGCTCTVTTP